MTQPVAVVGLGSIISTGSCWTGEYNTYWKLLD
jgi:hypothetical protein